MGLEDLADIHAARHAERIEHDVDRLPVGEERHVLRRHDLGNDALVAVPSRHLVAHGDGPLCRHPHTHSFAHPGGQVAARFPGAVAANVDHHALDARRHFQAVADALLAAAQEAL